MAATIDLARRKQIFSDLVQLQDQGASVRDSREQVATEYKVPVETIENIEKEGIEKEWPPLNE
jgi:hypothetical protein